MATNADAPARFTGQQRLILLLLLGSQFMLAVDFSILNVALPQVGSGVGLSLAALPWVVTAYALPTAGFTLLFGRIADLFGRRRLFLAGITLLAVSSLLGGIATEPVLLLTARTLQGLATAIATPAALSLLTTSFTDEHQRAKVLGLNGALLSAGFTAGALFGGMLVEALSWRWAFLINIPVALVILVVTPFVVRTSKGAAGVKLDIPGAVTVTAGLLAFAYGVTNRSWLAVIGGVALLGIFWLIELKAKAPLASVRILSRPSVKWGNLGGLVAMSMISALIFLLTLYLQDILHLAPLTTGLIFGIPGLASVFAGVFAGRVIARYGTRKMLTSGLVLESLFCIPLIFLGTSRASVFLLVALFFVFYAHMTAIVAYMVTATSGLPDSEQGLATGLATLAQQIAITIGVPILSAVAATQASQLVGLRVAVVFAIAVMLTGAALIWRGLRPRAEAVADDAGEHEPDKTGAGELAA